jgi:serine/threonine-protein kinase
MKLIQGHTLKDYINEMLDALELEGPGELNRRFPLLNRLEMLLRVCDAISYAHQRGVIHRDLKPANVMIGAFGEVYVMDWGIARLIRNDREAETLWIESGGEGLEERHVEHTRSGQVVGTPRYMSPEQARGENEFLDARTDLYVIGLMLYELVTLRKALSGDTLDKVLDRAAAGRVGPVEHRHSREHIPRPLRAIIRKAVAKQPDSRYQTVAELADDIRRFIRGEAVAAMPDTPVQAVYRWMGRHHALTLSMVLGIAVVAAVAVSWSLYAQMNAMEQARLREDRFTRFQANVDAVAHRIDTHFLRFQNILMLLADTVSWQISHGRPDEGHIYTLEAFQRESRQPPDFAFAPAYSQHVSFAHAVFILPSGKTGYDRELLRRLAPLSAGFRKALLDSRMQRRTLHPEEWRRQLAVQGTPIQWAYAALTNGLFIGYPGSGNYPDHFDPRARPWFRTGRNHREPVWSDPYMDAAVDHRVLSCAVSFYREDGSLQGVTAMDVPLKVAVRRIMDTLVLLPGHRACMLDEQGRVLACSDAGDSAQQGKEYPYPQLIKAMRRRDSGILLQPRGGDTLIYAYRRVETVRWYYVEWMRIRELLQQHDPSSGG